MIHHFKRLALAGLFFGTGLTGFGQAADALIDKLVNKGILNAQEAKELREESNRDFTKAYSVKSGLPEWVTSFKFKGDVRLRYEGLYMDDAMVSNGNLALDRERYRYRLRFGAVATLLDRFEVGLRLASGDIDNAAGLFSGTDPDSLNQTFQNNGSKKGVVLDLVYGKWKALDNPDWALTLTGGKMELPFVFSDMVFDSDYTPEGAAFQLTRHLGKQHDLKLTGAAFVLDENRAQAHDPYLLAAQARWDAQWSKAFKTTAGLAGLAISGAENLDSANVYNGNVGNSRVPPTVLGLNTELSEHYNPIVVDATATYTLPHFPLYKGPFPISLGGDYLHNPAVSEENYGWSSTLQLGKSGRKGAWDLSYTYRYLAADAWYEELTEGDWSGFYGQAAPTYGAAAGYGPGTNVRGHRIKFQYSLFNSTTLVVSYLLSDLINGSADPLARSDSSAINRLQIDVTWKF